MTPYEIPLTPEPQTFAIELGGVSRRMRFYWCKDAQCWCFDIQDQRGVDLLTGVPVVTGTDLLGQYAYMGLGGSIVAQTDHQPDAVPTFANLGTSGRVYFVVQ